jgi:hypothetical protein
MPQRPRVRHHVRVNCHIFGLLGADYEHLPGGVDDLGLDGL